MSNSLEQLKAAGTVSSSHLDPVTGDTTVLSNKFLHERKYPPWTLRTAMLTIHYHQDRRE
jgi:hypothetical protein